MATTYPKQVLEAVQWSKEHAKMKGKEAVKAADEKGWDPSVASLVAFPQVLEMLGKNPQWTQEVGEMFLADPDTVMETIQKLRNKAYTAGNLKNTKEQKVVVKHEESAKGGSARASASTGDTIIEIQPSSPTVIYVPVYDPTVVYGNWWWPTPPYFYRPAYWNPVGGIISFGIAIAFGHALWSHWDWHHHDININVNSFNHAHPRHHLDVARPHYSWRENIRPQNSHLKDLKPHKQIDRPAARPVPVQNDRMARPGEKSRDLQRQQAKQKLEQRGVTLQKSRQTLQKDSAGINQKINKANQMKPALAPKPSAKPRPAVHPSAPTPSTRPALPAKRPVSTRPAPKPSARPQPTAKPRPAAKPRPMPRPSVRPAQTPRPAIHRPAAMPRISAPKIPSRDGAAKAMHR